jgi:nucleoside 2-deoxyribosyltransferase
MAKLAGVRLYLGGPIECSQPNDWRSEPKSVFQNEFKIIVFDPHADPKQQWSPKLAEAKEMEDYETVEEIAKRFCRKDLCLVDRCDFLIAYLPKDVKTTGTIHEIINSNNAKKPTLLICPEGKKHIPGWLFAYIPHTNMFGSWEALYEYLRKVDRGEMIEDDRWHYVYGLI